MSQHPIHLLLRHEDTRIWMLRDFLEKDILIFAAPCFVVHLCQILPKWCKSSIKSFRFNMAEDNLLCIPIKSMTKMKVLNFTIPTLVFPVHSLGAILKLCFCWYLHNFIIHSDNKVPHLHLYPFGGHSNNNMVLPVIVNPNIWHVWRDKSLQGYLSISLGWQISCPFLPNSSEATY